MSRRSDGFLAGAVLTGFFVSIWGQEAVAQHAQAPPQADTRIDYSPPNRDYQPISPPPETSQPMIQRDSSSEGRSNRPVGQDPGEAPKPARRHIEKPPPTERCAEPPDARRWSHRTRDMMAWIKVMARRLGLVMALRVPDELTVLKGVAERPAGWIAYAFAVPANGTLRVTLTHPNEGWFQMRMMDKDGQLRIGMLPNLIKTGHPEVSFKNPTQELQVAFVLVDDPGWMSSEQSPFTLTVERDWEPGIVEPTIPESASGIWAIVEPIIKMEDGVQGDATVRPEK